MNVLVQDTCTRSDNPVGNSRMCFLLQIFEALDRRRFCAKHNPLNTRKWMEMLMRIGPEEVQSEQISSYIATKSGHPVRLWRCTHSGILRVF